MEKLILSTIQVLFRSYLCKIRPKTWSRWYCLMGRARMVSGAKLLSTTGKQKQVFQQGLDNVRTCLGLAVLSLQIALLANSIWRLPWRTIAYIKAAFA